MELTPNPITELRGRHGMSPEALADVLDLPERVIRAVEMKGRGVPPDVLERIDREIVRWLRGSPVRIDLPPIRPVPELRLLNEDEEAGGHA